MIRKLFPIFVAMVVVLAFGSVHAQTTVKIALPEGIIVSEGGTVVVASASGSISFTSQCMEGAGFTVGHPRVRAIIIDSSHTGALVVSNAVTNVSVAGRLVNLVLLATCSDGGTVYRVYSADVSPTPTTIVAVPSSFALLAETDRIVITAGATTPTSDQPFSSTCMADVGFVGVPPSARSVLVGSSTAGLIDLWFRDPLPPGTRLENPILVATCSDGGIVFRVYVADVVSPIHGGSLLVAAPAGVTLDTDAESVAKSDSDPDGISNFVCITPGSAAEHTELLCDVPIERGDRIVGFHSPLVDPDTGITYWWAELEY